MIKEVTEIPMTNSERSRSYRTLIRNDIDEAIHSGIFKFEFVGDYNFKTLAGIAREEADRYVNKIVRSWLLAHPNYKEKLKNCYCFDSLSIHNLKLIKVTSIKGDKPNTRRVFCEIKQDIYGALEKYAIEKIAEHEQRRTNTKE